MTEEELQYEYSVIYETRLGILAGASTSTREQREIARREADAAIKELRKQETLI